MKATNLNIIVAPLWILGVLLVITGFFYDSVIGVVIGSVICVCFVFFLLQPIIRRWHSRDVSADGIVAGGRHNLLKHPETQQKIDAAVREIRVRYAQERKVAGIIARIRLWFRIRREVRAAIETVAPSAGCYMRR